MLRPNGHFNQASSPDERHRGPEADQVVDRNCTTGVGSHLEVEAKSRSVTHTVSMGKVQDWLNGGAKSPSEKLTKERLKGLLAS